MMIVSGSIHAVVNAIVKGRRVEGREPIMAARAITDASSAVILLPAILFVPMPTGAWQWLGWSALAHVLYLYAMIRTYAVADFSAAYPAMRGTAPALTAAVTVGLLGEAVRPLALVGVALIAGSLFALVIGKHLGRAALGWALTTGAMTAVYTVIDVQGVRAAPSVASYIVWDFVLIGSESLALFALLSRGRIFADMRTQWQPGVIAGGLSIVTYGLALWAFALGPTAPLAALRETGMATALLISALFMGEAVTLRRAFAVAGILAGAALILTG
jgi:drug/metabolite transporter (DMT)-like permease